MIATLLRELPAAVVAPDMWLGAAIGMLVFSALFGVIFRKERRRRRQHRRRRRTHYLTRMVETLC